MTFLLIYLIGVFFAMILNVRHAMKELDVITLGDIAIVLVFSLFSWAVVLIEIGSSINWNRQIWKRGGIKDEIEKLDD